MALALLAASAAGAADTPLATETKGRSALQAKVKHGEQLVDAAVEQLVRSIKASTLPDDTEQASHNANTIDWLRTEQKNWLAYRESHCWLRAHVYAYPSTSRIAVAQYNACRDELSGQRIRYLRDFAQEFRK